MSKILLYAAILITLATAGLGTLNYRHSQLLVATARTVIEQQQQEVAKTNQELQSLKDQMASGTAREEQSKKEVLEAQQARDKAVSDLADVQKQLADKDAELTQRNNELLAKEATLQSLTAQQKSELPAPTQSSSSKKKLEKKKSASTSMTAVAASSTDDQQHPSTGAVEGKVAAVNQSWNFVVINLGEHDGIVNNAEMFIKREGQVIAKVKITSVEPLTSIGDIIPKSLAPGAAIQVGDVVVPEASK